MSKATTQEFGKWRSRLWPIHNFELKKLLPMIFMFFLILFNYTVLRDSKDTMLVSEISNLAIPVVKIFGTSLGAILFLLIYSKMANLLSKPALFYSSIAPFIGFFCLFSTVLYPHAEALQLDRLSDWIQGVQPSWLAGWHLDSIVRKWPYPLFYIVSELWGTVCVSLLFWGFANDITRVNEAKRVYPLFGLFGNFALMLAGPSVTFFSSISNKPGFTEQQAYGLTLHYLMGLIVLSAAMIVAIYAWMQKNVLTDPRFYSPDEVKKKKDKPKMSMIESFKYLAQSRYLLCIAILVLAYGMAINLVEVTWKGQLKEYYTTKNAYSAFMGVFSGLTGVATVFSMLFVGGNMMRRFGWTATALFTPIVLLITSIGFFSFIIFQDSLGGMIAMFGITPLFMAVLFGAAQNILSKAAKYSLFDPTKEMAYIPLDQEQKVKGKAAIDVAGARLGKSGGSALQLGFAMVPILAANMVPVVGVFVIGITLAWIAAAKALGTRFNALTEQREAEEAKKTVSVEGAATA
ncbi:MAG: NTP/NDP exchange transporter [Verrucomicrobia bacterium]|nr:NTP/NDP exchange transporter [Verrucomicrobiota bacterium]